MQFKNRLAVVTGGASGIGKGVCEVLLERGAIIAAIDLNQKSLQAAASSLREPPKTLVPSLVMSQTDMHSQKQWILLNPS